ncbi:MAG: MFS transporter [Isosphaeraceae bacterium]
MGNETGSVRQDTPELKRHPLRGLLVAQSIGAFNDNAWKQVVALLAVLSAADESKGQEQVAIAQIVLMIPLMFVSLPAGVLADRMSKRTVIVSMKVLEVLLMLAGALVLLWYPTGGAPALLILGLLGVQAALFSPAKYGILPEILPHEKLSAGNGLLEMWTNVAMIAGTVMGGVILQLARGNPWIGGVVLAALAAVGLMAALTVPHVPAARAEGGLVKTVTIAWDAIRADRVLKLAILGQIFVWSVACVVPPPALSYAKKVLELPESVTGFLWSRSDRHRPGVCWPADLGGEGGVWFCCWGPLGLTLSTLAFALIGPGVFGTMALMSLIGVFSGFLFVPLNALAVAACLRIAGAVIASWRMFWSL